MKSFIIGLTLGIALLAVALSPAFAQMGTSAPGSGRCFQDDGMPMMRQGGGAGMMNHEHHLWRQLNALGLDEKQKDAVRDIVRKTARETVKKKAELQLVRIDLREVLGKDQVDMAAAEATLKKMAALQTELRLSHIKTLQEIKTKLTPEQRKKFNDLHDMGPFADAAGPAGKRAARKDAMLSWLE